MRDIIEKQQPLADSGAKTERQSILFILDFLKFFYELLKLVLIVIILAASIRYLLISPYQVDGSSMHPTLTDKDYLLVEKFNYIFQKPNRSDIIVFRYPLNPSINYVKRIIGLPNEKVTIKSGRVFITNSQYPSGYEIQEGYLASGTKTAVAGDESEKSWSVNAGEYFVMGDNRSHSDDSRSWGIVPVENILGKVWVEIYPVSHFGIVEHATY